MHVAEHKFTDGGGRYAQVTLSVEPAEHGEIVVSPNAFEWLKEDYGPDAWEWPVCDEWRCGAVAGVDFALSHAAPSASPILVTVLKIHAHPAHSDRGAVAFAACHATWKAIGDPGLSASEVQPTGPLFGPPGS